MLFSENVFLFAFLPAVLAVYYLCPRVLRNPVLLIFSLVFYGWGEPVYLILMVAAIALNYLFGLLIHGCQRRGSKGTWALVTGVAVNLLLLGYFKYAGFVLQQLQLLIPVLSAVQLPQITLPIGISFYIFQSMSYIIDVYRGDTRVQKNPLDFGTYVALFPQLIAGPIVRYRDVAAALKQRTETLAGFSSGIILFTAGLAKKVLLANHMGNLWLQLQSQRGTAAAWMGLAAYALQIYFDFSGYSDMARGLGRMFGFEFLENFNYPYICRSITDFWRRWHISLSTWFKEYVYIPLGGNRKGLPRQLVNIGIVWALTGLWHGASWNFLLWGVYYALLLILEKTFLLKQLEKLPEFVGHLYALLAVLLGWALFYFEDLTQLGQFLGRLFSFTPTTGQGLQLVAGFLPLLLCACFAATPVAKKLLRRFDGSTGAFALQLIAVVAGLLLCTAALASQSYNPFIYFRF